MARKMGEILLSSRLVTEEQLKLALDEQRRSGGRLGEALVKLGFVSETDVARTLSEQLGLPFLPGTQIQVDERVARIIPETVARQYEALPIAEDDGKVVVAMVDPLNVFALDDIGFLAGKEARALVVTREALLRAIQRVYHGAGDQQPGRADLPARPDLPARADRPGPGRAERSEPGRAGTGADDGDPVRTLQEASIIPMVDQIIHGAIEDRASDIHIEPQEGHVRVRYRVDGLLREVACISSDVLAPVVSRIKIMAAMDISEKRLPQDGRIRVREGGLDVDLRVSTLPTVFGEKVVIRVLDKSRAITSLADLGMMPDTLERYRNLIRNAFGMILVTGPTGSGKTTTLVATLHQLNSAEKNIITIEDPVEYQVPGVNQVQVNVKAGLTFASGLRAFLRQDPDVIMVGEIRDLETAEIAIRAALTGHLVLSTLHTNEAVGAITRLLDMGLEPYLVASSVIGSLAQRLARRLCERCKEPYEVPAHAPERLVLGLPEGPLHAYRGAGCPECGGTGYRGRLALFELLVMTPELREMVTAKVSADLLRKEALARGTRTLTQDGVAKALQGLTSLDEVQRVAYYEG